jgi:Ankyrin repeats (many copies)
LEARSNDGYTALHYASITGRLTVVRYLIQNGANVNAMNIGGMTPLHLAVAYGRLNITSFFLDFDTSEIEMNAMVLAAECYTDIDDTLTALQLAMSNGRSDIVKDLVKKFVRP